MYIAPPQKRDEENPHHQQAVGVTSGTQSSSNAKITLAPAPVRTGEGQVNHYWATQEPDFLIRDVPSE